MRKQIRTTLGFLTSKAPRPVWGKIGKSNANWRGSSWANVSWHLGVLGPVINNRCRFCEEPDETPEDRSVVLCYEKESDARVLSMCPQNICCPYDPRSNPRQSSHHLVGQSKVKYLNEHLLLGLIYKIIFHAILYYHAIVSL